MIGVAPEIEGNIRNYAEREGLTVDELLVRTFPLHSQTKQETPEQTARRVQGLLEKWQSKNPLPVPPGGFKSLAELSAEWAAEDEKLTVSERAANRELWAQHEQAIIDSPGVAI